MPAPSKLYDDQLYEGSVYFRIRQRILRNEIPPATRINIEQLARELDVSPTPVREALKQLKGAGLVTQQLGRGYATTSLLNPTQLRDMFELRLLLEPWAARAVSHDRLSNPGTQLKHLVKDLERLMESKPDIRFELVEHDSRFHEIIFAATRNEMLHRAYSQLHVHLHAFRLHPNDYSGSKTLHEHEEIASAIQSSDGEAAEQLMRNHLIKGYERFGQGYEDSEDHLPLTEEPYLFPGNRVTL